MSYTYEITTAGKVLIAKAQTGISIEFTKAELGKGDLTGSPAEFTSLLDHVPTNVIVQQKEYIEGSEEAKITLTYDNETLSEGFYVKEIGIYANDPDEGEILFLYCYSDDADYLPLASYASVEQVVNLIIKVDNASDVTAQIIPETSVIRDNFAANSILKADSDNEPEALIVDENSIVGRKAGGKIDALSVSEVREMLNISDFPCRHAIQTLGNGITIDDELVSTKFNEVLSEVGNGAARSVNFGLNMISDSNGGMVLAKNKDSVQDWFLGSSLLGAGKQIYTNLTDAIAENDGITSFTTSGVDFGAEANNNADGSNIAEFGFQTTHEKVRTFEEVKSVIFDFADNWGHTEYSGIRSIEFEENGIIHSLLPSDFSAYANTVYGIDNGPEKAFDTSLSKTGVHTANSWLSATSITSNMRIIIVFNNYINFDRIIINNYHNGGNSYTTRGIKNTKIYTSTDEITNTTYGAEIPNSELIFNGIIAQHPASDIEDDRSYCGVHWSYNPATGFFMLLHDGDGGSANYPIENVTGKPIIFCNTKSLDVSRNHFVYNIISGVNYKLFLNITDALAVDVSTFIEMSEIQLSFGPSTGTNNAGERFFSWGFVGEDLGYITPGMTGAEDSVSLHKLTDGGTFDCGIDESKIQSIIMKQLDGVSNWETFNSYSGWNKKLELNTNNLEGDTSHISIAGSMITVTGLVNKWLILVIGKNGLVATQNDVKGNEVLSETGNGTSRSIDFGLDYLNKHGMVLFKNKGPSTVGWRLGSTMLGDGGFLQLNSTNGLNVNLEIFSSYDSEGVNVGSEVGVNDDGIEYAELAFHCTHEKVREFENVKSVIFDFADNIGGSSYDIGIRSIEFEALNGNIISLEPETDFSSYVSSERTSYESKNSFDTSLSKTGSSVDSSWLSPDGIYSNQRLIIVFNNLQTFKRIIINNYHSSGGGGAYGVKNTKIYASTDEITDTTYGTTISNSEKIFDGVIAQHTASDVEDDKYYCGVHQAYNPATGFFMMTHDGDNGSADFLIKNWMGKRPIFCSTKNIDYVTDHTVYSVITGNNNLLTLNSTDGSALNTNFFLEMSEKNFLFGRSATRLNQSGYRYFTWGFVGEDLGYLTPGMWGNEGTVSIIQLTDGGTYDCGIDESKVKAVVLKRIDSTSSWNIYNSSSGFDRYLSLNSTGVETIDDTITLSGSEITLPSGYSGDWIVLIIGKDGIMPSGKSINIKADSNNPFIASIADGFGPYGPVDYPVIETSNKQLNLNLEDGTSHLCVNRDGEYSLDNDEPDFDNSPGVMRGTQKKLKLGEVTVMSGDIVDIDLMEVGDRYESEWFPVEVDTLYELENKFKDTKVDFDIWWNSEPTDENKRWVTGYYWFDSTSSLNRAEGAYKRVSRDSLYIGTGNTRTFYSSFSGDPEQSNNGYYKIIVKREW